MIHIYHTNDIHSNFEFLKKVNSYLKKNKKDSDFYFDSGDYTDLKNLIVQADQGKSALELLKASFLDYMAIGNNEIDLGYDSLKNLAENNPIICANLTKEDDSQIPSLKKSVVLTREGKRFLIIAIAPYYSHDDKPNAYNFFFMMYGLKSQDPYVAIAEELNNNIGKYDYCILLSHSGSLQDTKIMERYPQINLILGGHDHKIISSNRYSQSGAGEALGKVTLSIDNGKIHIVENVQIELSDEENESFDRLKQQADRKANDILSKELNVIEELSFHPYQENHLINFICDALRKQFKADLAIMHNGIAERELKRPVSRKTLIEIFPSKLNPTIYPIKGKKIREAILLSFDKNHVRKDGKGAGFRGSTLGTLSYSYNVKIKGREIYINDEKLDINKEYRLVTDDYLQRGTGYPSLKVNDSICEYDMWFIRDLVEHYLLDKEVFETSKLQRVIKK